MKRTSHSWYAWNAQKGTQQHVENIPGNPRLRGLQNISPTLKREFAHVMLLLLWELEQQIK